MNLLQNRNIQVLYLMLSTACFCTGVNAQQSPELMMGKVISSINKTPVTYAMIINVSSKANAYTDSLGYYSIPVKLGDTLLISRIGFHQKEIRIFETSSIKIFNTIELEERAYELNTVNINSFGTYEQFKYKVLNTEVPEENRINPSITKAFSNKVVVLEPQARIPLGSPVTAAYMLLSKEGKTLRKLEKEEAKDREVDSYKHKYSPEKVSELTGLKDLELEKFMKYCNLDINFIKNAIELDIAEKVLDCYKRYQAEQKAPVP